MKVATKPVAEAPSAQLGEDTAALREKAQEAPMEKKDAELLNEAGRAPVEPEKEAFRYLGDARDEKAEEPFAAAKRVQPTEEAEELFAEPEELPEVPSAPARLDRAREEGAAPHEEDAIKGKGTAFGESYFAAEKKTGAEVWRPYQMSVNVRDADAAIEAVRESIERVGGRIIESEAVEVNVIEAEIERDKVDELTRELEKVGEVSSVAPEIFEEPVRVRIELKEEPE